MKETPKDTLLRPDMEPGRLVRDGFLGGDPRTLSEIIAEDEAALNAAGISARQVGEAMRELTRRGLEGGGPDGGYEVAVEEYLGLIGCPFKDGVRVAKRNTSAKDLKTGRSLRWTDLSLHLIEEHGFFQGKGSPYRLEPLEAASFLKLI